MACVVFSLFLIGDCDAPWAEAWQCCSVAGAESAFIAPVNIGAIGNKVGEDNVRPGVAIKIFDGVVRGTGSRQLDALAA